MCTSKNFECMSPPSLHSLDQKTRSKRFQVRIQIQIQSLVHRRKRVNKFVEEKMKREMELKNLKLYMENMSILQENEKLRKKATLLRQENLSLLSVFEKKKFAL